MGEFEQVRWRDPAQEDHGLDLARCRLLLQYRPSFRHFHPGQLVVGECRCNAWPCMVLFGLTATSRSSLVSCRSSKIGPTHRRGCSISSLVSCLRLCQQSLDSSCPSQCGGFLSTRARRHIRAWTVQCSQDISRSWSSHS